MENENVIDQMLKGLLQKTIENKIPWKSVNANAMRWTKQDTRGIINVTLQKQPTPLPTNSHFILTIQTPGATATQLNSQTQPALKDHLTKLFDEAIKVANSESMHVLKRLLDGL